MSRIAYLTFDDGPSEPYTSQILEILKKENIKATFFVCGKNVERLPEILKKVYEAGHAIGNHSYSHSKKLTLLGSWREISKTNTVVRRVIGQEPKLYRAPYGYFMPWILPYILYKRMRLVGWNILGKDWKEQSPQDIANNVLSKERDNLIVLLHDGKNTEENLDRSRTVQALPVIISELRKRGYSFSSIS